MISQVKQKNNTKVKQDNVFGFLLQIKRKFGVKKGARKHFCINKQINKIGTKKKKMCKQ